MDIWVDEKITNILEPYVRKFYSACIDEEEDYYNKYITMDNNTKFNNFIWTVIGDNKVFKQYYNILLINGCNKKEVNKFFYAYLKMKKKSEDGCWSWSEIDEWDIPLEDIKKTSTKFSFI